MVEDKKSESFYANSLKVSKGLGDIVVTFFQYLPIPDHSRGDEITMDEQGADYRSIVLSKKAAKDLLMELIQIRNKMPLFKDIW